MTYYAGSKLVIMMIIVNTRYWTPSPSFPGSGCFHFSQISLTRGLYFSLRIHLHLSTLLVTSGLRWSRLKMEWNQSVMVWHHWYVPSRHGMRVCSMTVRRVPQYILLSSIGLHDTWWSRAPAIARDRGESQRPKKVDFDIYSIHCLKENIEREWVQGL